MKRTMPCVLCVLTATLVIASPDVMPSRAFENGAKAQESSADTAPSRIPSIVVPTIDPAELVIRDAATFGANDPLRIAEAASVSVSCKDFGAGQTNVDGSTVWRMAIEAPGALAIGLGFTNLVLPTGAVLHVYDREGRFRRSVTAADVDDPQGTYWSEFFRGSRVVLELVAPPGAAEGTRLNLGTVNRGYRDSTTALAAATCERNVICSEGDAWRREIRSVAKYTFQVGGQTAVCTATLLNSVPQLNRNYILTASHCVNTDALAQTMHLYWNYESTACETVTGATQTDQQQSPQLRATWPQTDVTLLELRKPPAANAYYAGWDATAQSSVAVPPAATIHHPQGEAKRISISWGDPPTDGYCNDPYTDHYYCMIVSGWQTGTVEHGSSGAALFDANHRVIGQLKGGFEAQFPDPCPGNVYPSAFGRLSMSFSNGPWGGPASPATELRGWLDPDCTGGLVIAGKEVNDVAASCSTSSDIAFGSRVTPSSVRYRGSIDRALAWGCGQYGAAVMNDDDGEVYFVRMYRTGALIPNSQVKLSNSQGHAAFPAIAWNGEQFAVVWHDTRTANVNGDIYLAMIAPDGVIIAPERNITNQVHYSIYPDIAWTGTNFGVVWMDGRDNNYNVYFQRLGRAGDSVGGNVRVTSDPNHSYLPEIVWNGSEYAVVWYDNRISGGMEIYFALLDETAVKKAGFEKRVTSSPATAEDPSLAWNGTGYGLAYHDNRGGKWGIWFKSLNSAGDATSGDLFISNDSEHQGLTPSIAWGAGEYGLSWRDDRYEVNQSGNWEILFTRLDRNGAVTDRLHRVTVNPGLSGWSSVAWNGSEFGLLWNDNSDGYDAVYGGGIGCCADADSDANNACAFDPTFNPLGGDCRDDVAAIHRGAVESNDGIDNQCPSDPGYGVIDEISGMNQFPVLGDKTQFGWTPQSGATAYQVVRSTTDDFSSGCTLFSSSQPFIVDADVPPPDGRFYYLVRTTAPFLGSWGQQADGTARPVPCVP